MTEPTERQRLRDEAPADLRKTIADLDSIAKSNADQAVAVSRNNIPMGTMLLRCPRPQCEGFGLTEAEQVEHAAKSIYEIMQRSMIEQHVFATSQVNDDQSRLTVVEVPESYNYDDGGRSEDSTSRVFISDFQEGFKKNAISRAADGGSLFPMVNTYFAITKTGRIISKYHPDIAMEEINGCKERFLSAVSKIEPASKALEVLRQLDTQAAQMRTTLKARSIDTRSATDGPLAHPVEVLTNVTANDIASRVSYWSDKAKEEQEKADQRGPKHPRWPKDRRELRALLSNYTGTVNSGADQEEAKEQGRFNIDKALASTHASVTAGQTDDNATASWGETDLNPSFSQAFRDQNTKDTLKIRFYKEPQIPNLTSLMPDESTVASALAAVEKRTASMSMSEVDQTSGELDNAERATDPQTASTALE
ncbi:hypothetical protein IAT40_007350 [Kwoniella sp. CBS 6097]